MAKSGAGNVPAHDTGNTPRRDAENAPSHGTTTAADPHRKNPVEALRQPMDTHTA